MKILTPKCTATERQHISTWVRSCNKHVERLKPSYTVLFDVWTFDILTRETVSQEGGRFPPFFARSARWLFSLVDADKSVAQASHKSMEKNARSIIY